MTPKDVAAKFGLGLSKARDILREAVAAGKLEVRWFKKKTMCGRNGAFARYCPV